MNKKIIVTHIWPDFDAITSVWLVKKYLPGFKTAEIKFVPAGSTLNNRPPDENPNIIHVDTGKGKFDHHQYEEQTSAAEKIFIFLKKHKYIPKKDILPLEKIIKLVTFVDNFQEVNLPNPTDDIYELLLSQLLEGLNLYLQNNNDVMNIGLILINSLFQIMKNKVKAEKEVKKGLIFQTKWGKALAVYSNNEETVKYALKSGFVLVVRKDPNKGFLRIKASPNSKVDLTETYEKVKSLDPKATWFLHESKKMLLNGSAKNPSAKITKLGLKEIVGILKKE